MAVMNNFYDKMIRLISKDGKFFEITMRCAYSSELLKNIIETTYEFQNEIFEIPISFDSRFINYLVSWLNVNSKYMTNEFLSTKIDERRSYIMRKKELNQEENDFFDVTTDDDKIELVNMSNLLDIPELYHSVILYIARLAKGKSPEDFRRILERSDIPIPEELSKLIPGIENNKILIDEQKDKEKRSLDEKQFPQLTKKVKFAD